MTEVTPAMYRLLKASALFAAVCFAGLVVQSFNRPDPVLAENAEGRVETETRGNPGAGRAVNAAAAEVVQSSPFWSRRFQLLTLLENAKSGDVPALEKLLREAGRMRSLYADGELKLIERRIGELAGAEALAGYESGDLNAESARCRLAGFASVDGAAARRWLASREDACKQAPLVAGLIDGLFETDPVLAEEAFRHFRHFEVTGSAEILSEASRRFRGLKAEKAENEISGAPEPATIVLIPPPPEPVKSNK